ncbi:MAG TPA: DUF5667 domain-containing protein [Actinomycetota bacterium]|nr:DUF5667 domain-containing protein [Actinomycetota bacterium]
MEASPELERLRKIANALAPTERPSPSSQFRARLRNELLAAASVSEEDTFAALLEGLPIEAPAEVGALVAVAAALQPASLPLPDPAFRYRLRNELIDMASGRSTLGARARNRFVAINERMRRSFRVVVATGLAAAILAGGGATLAAASSALPGDALYPVKLFRENVQLAFASGTTEGLKRLQFARTRLDEIRGLEARGSRNSDLYISTLDRMDSLTQTGSTILIDAVRAGGAKTSILKSVGGFTSVQQQDLQALIPNMPVGALPAARDSLVLLETVTHTVNAVLSGCPCNPPSNPLIPQSGSATSSSPSVQCTCNQTNNGSDSQASGGNSNSGASGGNTRNPAQKPQTPTTSPSGPVEQLVPDVPGTNVDNQVTGLIDSLISKVPVPVPSITPPPLVPSHLPTPSLPGLP